MADHSSRYCLPLPEESLPSQANLNSREEVEMELSRGSTGKLTLYSEDTGRKRTKGNINSLICWFWWPQTALRPRIDGRNTQYPSVGPISGLTSITPDKYPLPVDPVIQESQVKKVLVDGGSNINVTFPRTLQALGVSIADLT
jgi:hypothetical protein